MSPGMAPLFFRPAGAGASGLCAQLTAVEQRLEPFFLAGVLGSSEVHVAAQLGRLAGALDEPDVVLAVALAVRAPLHGHVCVDLGQVDDSLRPDPDDLEGSGPPGRAWSWPADRQAWRDAVAACHALVRIHLKETGEPPDAAAKDPPGGGGQGRATPLVLDGWRLYLDRYWQYQQRLARELRRRAGDHSEEPADVDLLRTGLARLFATPERTGGEGGAEEQGKPSLDRQMLGAAMSALRPLCVISGGPGMGKTWTIRKILVLALAQRAAAKRNNPALPRFKVALAAPTGKAAARMREAILDDLDGFLASLDERVLGQTVEARHVKAFMEELEPRTLHRLLGYDTRNTSRFRHHARNPLPHHLVVVDETSMVDLPLMSKLVDAVASGSRLILLGDRHQLASVEAGAVLADICGDTGAETLATSSAFAGELRDFCGLDLSPHGPAVAPRRGLHDCIVQLNQNYRFEETTGIGAFARACLAPGETFDAGRAAAVLSPGAGHDDTTFLPHGREGLLTSRVQRTITAGYRGYLETLLLGPRPGEPEPSFHRRVLATLDAFRVLCAHRRGRLGVSGLNAAIEEQLAAQVPGFEPSEDHYLGRPVLIRRNDYAVKRFNGDVGVVVRRASVTGQPSLQVAFPGTSDEPVEYLAPSRLPEHQTVFAMTIHKSQGSQFDHALIVLPSGPSPILTRELIYTGVTRAAREVTLVGDPRILEDALSRTVQRASGLREELWSEEWGTGNKE